ncbi:ATP-binding protein [Desulforamulus aquiferis]|uniref:histidine kinase n=2 Tax=Desulforamulus aquiferis TaxID=1397668 RepID=A0AAW7ZGY1_9FIRM|nr:ATP-binding protein [Desulforamulus aquiferis]
MSLVVFTIAFIVTAEEKVSNWIYVVPITMVSLTCGFRIGLATTLLLGIHMLWMDGDISVHNLPVFLCLLLMSWLVGQISEVNFRQALQLESERRFLADLIETFSGGIVVSNSDGEVILCNREIKNVFHREKADIIGKGESLLWVNSSIPFHKWQSNFINMELSIGSREYLVSRFSIAGIEPGKKCYVTVLNDITEVQMQREKLHNLTTLSALGELAAGAAHEIKNPLTTIRGFLQLLRDKNGSHQLNELYALSIEELDRINYIVNSMLQLAKPDMDEPQKLSLSYLVKETWELYTCSAVKKGIRVENNLDDDLHEIMGSRKQIKQVLLNFIQNAEKACSQGDKIIVKTYMNSGWVCLEVRDTGKGIHPDHVDKLFSPFFTTEAEGTGIGLAICKRIISDHNGRIQLESELGLGTSFTVSFIPIDNQPAG